MENIKISEIATLPSIFGNFKIQTFKEGIKEHLVIFSEALSSNPIVRIHSECLTGDALGSLKCDCRNQLEYSLKTINKEGGLVIYLRQEGRNIGLYNKVNAYSLQDKGFDTIEANLKLGFKSDERTYEIVDFILDYLKIKQIQLLTNNPKKIQALENIEVIKRCPIITDTNEYNENYLKTKKDLMGHLF